MEANSKKEERQKEEGGRGEGVGGKGNLGGREGLASSSTVYWI